MRVSQGCRLARPPPEARALVWAWSPAGRPDGPAPPLHQSEPAAPTSSSEGRRRRVGTVARWRRAPGSLSGNYRYRPATRTSTESADWRSRPGRCPRASGYPTLLPPAEGARGVQCLLSPASAEEGAPGGFFPPNPFPRLRKWQPTVKQTKTIRLLAVDHSARASMKNAASCEN